MDDATGLTDKPVRPWAIRAGSFLVPVAHAAGQNVVTVLGLRYLTDNLGMAAGAAGLIFAGVKIYDGFLDPAVGAWSDNAVTRWGRRLPFLMAGGVAMPLGLAMLFGIPDFGSILATQIVVTLALALHASGFTLLTIPGFAMVSFVSPYYPVANAEVRRFLEESGFSVVRDVPLLCKRWTDIAKVTPQRLREVIDHLDGPEVDAIVQVGTNLSMVSLAAEYEAKLDKPVIAINSATYWHALRTLGITDRIDGLGRLLAEF